LTSLIFLSTFHSAVESSPLSYEGAEWNNVKTRVCVRKAVVASCGLAGLAPVSLKLCNSFARPHITAQ